MDQKYELWLGRDGYGDHCYEIFRGEPPVYQPDKKSFTANSDRKSVCLGVRDVELMFPSLILNVGEKIRFDVEFPL